jgi:predicted nucleotidyltransferase component of viral defense system
MNLFDQAIATAFANKPEYRGLQAVVEKELLHHDILSVLSAKNYLTDLTFIGGTCLRTCYGSQRLSEDLDFTGGKDFSAGDLSQLGKELVKAIQQKYGLTVQVTEPHREAGNVATWKLRVLTRPESPALPQQRINIDICAVPSHDVQVRAIIDHYGVAPASHGLFVRSESREEIFTDKILALAMRNGRFKARDIWDLQWLSGRGVGFRKDLLQQKLADRQLEQADFYRAWKHRLELELPGKEAEKAYFGEIQRFIPSGSAGGDTNNKADIWEGLLNSLRDIQF